MEDKRVTKTKKNIKETFINMLSKISFEQITVTKLCSEANISRITFYSHFNDKYELVDTIFDEMINLATTDYNNLQLKNNKDNNPILSYCNLLDCILNLYYNHFNFFHYATPDTNPYLAFSFYKYVLKAVEYHTKKLSKILIPKYSPKKITGFICYGLCGFINEGHLENSSINDMRIEAKEVLQNLLRSDILTKSITKTL